MSATPNFGDPGAFFGAGTFGGLSSLNVDATPSGLAAAIALVGVPLVDPALAPSFAATPNFPDFAATPSFTNPAIVITSGPVPTTIQALSSIAGAVIGALTMATPNTFMATPSFGSITFTGSATVFAPNVAAFAVVQPPANNTDVFPETVGATPSFDTPLLVAPITITGITFEADSFVDVPTIVTQSSLPQLADAVLYAAAPFRDFVNAPAFVRYRHRFRGQRESYKFNGEISAFLFDVLKMYERTATIKDTLASHFSVAVDGGTLDNTWYFPFGTVPTSGGGGGGGGVTQVFGSLGETFGGNNLGDTFGSFVNTGGGGGGGPIIGPTGGFLFTFQGILDLSLRLEKLRYRVSHLEKTLL